NNEGLPVEWQSLGGTQARRIHFFPTTGQLTEKFVQHDSQIDRAPVKPNAQQRTRPSGVELF
ncbi:MAG: chemotaxis protein CheD, partial [Pseudomonadota bacterium]